jgi:hypothetical protein
MPCSPRSLGSCEAVVRLAVPASSFNALSPDGVEDESRDEIQARYGPEPGTVALVLVSRAIYEKGCRWPSKRPGIW